MKLSFTEKMIIDSIEERDDTTRIMFVSYLKEDYVERCLRITLTNGVATHLYFSSNDHGTASWARGLGIVDTHRWETEDDLAKGSYLSRHYPVLIEDGAVPDHIALEKIVPDVLDRLLDAGLSRALSDLIASPEKAAEPDWAETLARNIELSDEFVAGLIAGYEREIELLEKGPRRGSPRDRDKDDGISARDVTERQRYASRLSSLAGKGSAFLRKLFVDGAAPAQAEKSIEEARSYLERARNLSRKIQKM